MTRVRDYCSMVWYKTVEGEKYRRGTMTSSIYLGTSPMSGTVYALSSNTAVSQNKESYAIGGLEGDIKTGLA